jgi:thiamine transport system substrate-binding protein
MIGTTTPVRITLAALTCTVALVASGCSSSGTASGTGAPSPSAGGTTPPAAPTPAGTATSAGTSSSAGTASSPARSASAASGTVTLLTHDAFAVSDDLVKQFEEATGLTLNVVTGGDAGAVVAGAVLAAGSPSGDVLFGVDNTLVSRALAANVFDPYASSAEGSLVPALREDTSGGYVTPIDYGDVCVNIDNAYFASKGIPAPSTLDDLASAPYKDLLVVEDPGTSSPGLAFLLATIARYGDGWKDYWAKLADNGVKVAGSWTDAYTGAFTAGGGKGDRPLVVSYATSPPAEIVYATDPKPTEPSTSVMTDGCYRQVEYAGVLAGAANPEGARKVVDWLLSPEVQADVPLSMFVFPAREGVALPDVFTKFAAVVDTPLQLDPQEVTDNLSTWLADWGTVVGR